MSINKVRKALYGIAKILGDINAVKRGTVGKKNCQKSRRQSYG